MDTEIKPAHLTWNSILLTTEWTHKGTNLVCDFVNLVCGGATLLALLLHNLQSPQQFREKSILCVGKTEEIMGLSTFPGAAEGVLPVIVMNTVLSVTILKNMVRSVLQVVGGDYWSESSEYEQNPDVFSQENVRERRVSTTQYKSLLYHDDTTRISSCSGNLAMAVECCVCLCKFEAEEEVSELSCRHLFHKSCLEKWFDSERSTCPLCRSVD